MHLWTGSRICGSVVDIGKIENNSFLLQNNQFFTKGVEISANIILVILKD